LAWGEEKSRMFLLEGDRQVGDGEVPLLEGCACEGWADECGCAG